MEPTIAPTVSPADYQIEPTEGPMEILTPAPELPTEPSTIPPTVPSLTTKPTIAPDIWTIPTPTNQPSL